MKQYRPPNTFDDDSYFQTMMDFHKPKWKNYQDVSYILNHIKEMILYISDHPHLHSKLYNSPYIVLRDVMDRNGRFIHLLILKKNLLIVNLRLMIIFYLVKNIFIKFYLKYQQNYGIKKDYVKSNKKNKMIKSTFS